MKRRWAAIAVPGLLFALVLGLTSCGDEPRQADTSKNTSSTELESAPPSEKAVRQGPSPFAKLRNGDAWDIEQFASLFQLVRRSDLVIVGEVTGARWGTEYREDRGDESEVFRDLVFEVKPLRAMRGKPVGKRPDSVDIVIDVVDPRTTQLEPPVGEDAVFFLRRVGSPVPGVPEAGADPSLLDEKVYRLVGSLGILDEGNGQLVFPLGGAAWAEKFLKSSWDDAVSKIAQIGAS